MEHDAGHVDCIDCIEPYRLWKKLCVPHVVLAVKAGCRRRMPMIAGMVTKLKCGSVA